MRSYLRLGFLEGSSLRPCWWIKVMVCQPCLSDTGTTTIYPQGPTSQAGRAAQKWLPRGLSKMAPTPKGNPGEGGRFLQAHSPLLRKAPCGSF